MSGILDSKSRVIDTILTEEGRSQLSQGGIDIAYLSFSDSLTFYRADLVSGSQDATARIYLESCQLPQDQIALQADDQGNVLPFGNANSIAQGGGGTILSYTYTGVSSSVVGGTQGVSASQGSAFAGFAVGLLESSLQNFSNLMVLASQDSTFEQDVFAMGPDQVTFTINAHRPIRNPGNQAVHISSLDGVFADPRFQSMPNFRYLPPINKVPSKGATLMTKVNVKDPSQTGPLQLGTYPPWGRTGEPALSYEQIKYELSYFEQLGYARQVNVDPTSSSNNMVGQFFELQFGKLRKLEVVDFGKVWTGDPTSPSAHVFFIGKVMVDERGVDTFIHLFTLVFG